MAGRFGLSQSREQLVLTSLLKRAKGAADEFIYQNYRQFDPISGKTYEYRHLDKIIHTILCAICY